MSKTSKPLDPEFIRQRGIVGAHESWARTTDRSARTAPARAALEKKWLDMAGGDPVRAESFRKAHYARMTLAAIQARRAKAAARKEAVA